MTETSTDVLDSPFEDGKNIRRRHLLPWWMKTLTWLFLLGGAFALVGVIFGLLGMQVQLALYGLQTSQPLSLTGLGIIALFLIKGITAFGYWWEKDWAIIVGQFDALLGIVVCAAIMLYPFLDDEPGFKVSFRLELLALIPYLIKLGKMKDQWAHASIHV